MYTIGEFAKASGLTPKALRLYEERRLLVPTRDPHNGYRHYTKADLQVALRIFMLKNLGFSLEEIGEVTRVTGGQGGRSALESAVTRRLRQCRSDLATLSERERTLSHLLLVLRNPEHVSQTPMQHLLLSAKERADMLQTLQAEHHQLSIKNSRESNNDSTLVVQHEAGDLYIIADGMGPGQEGKRASTLACTTVAKHLDRDRLTPETWQHHLEHLIALANQAILEECEPEGEHKPGTTLSFVVVKDGFGYIGHVGDTRVYRFTRIGGQLQQLTKDHTRIRELLDAGDILERDIQGHPEQHQLYAAVGVSDTIPAVFTTTEPLTANDALLLTSDGVTSVLSDREIVRVLQASNDLDQAAQRLIELSQRHGEDNASVVVAKLATRH